MRRKQPWALLLALSLTATLALPAGAETYQNGMTYQDIDMETGLVGNPVGIDQEDGADKLNGAQATDGDQATWGTETELVGTIQATQLKVTVPARVYFNLLLNVGMDLASTEDPTIQVVQPEVTIQNHSLVPVYGWVDSVVLKENPQNSSMLTDNEHKGSGIKYSLTTDPAELTKTKKMMFGFKAVNGISDLSHPDQWLLEGAQSARGTEEDPFYYPLKGANGRIEAYSTATGQPGKIKMQVYARSQAGWHAGDDFTVVPHILVSVLPPQKQTATQEEELQTADLATQEESTGVDESLREPVTAEQETDVDLIDEAEPTAQPVEESDEKREVSSGGETGTPEGGPADQPPTEEHDPAEGEEASASAGETEEPPNAPPTAETAEQSS